MRNSTFRMLAIVAIAVFTMSITASAQQKGDMAVGGNLVYGTGDDYSNFGIGAKFQWNVIDNLRLEPSFTYFLKKDYLTMWDLSVNAQYLFPVGGNVFLYPLAGLGILGAKAKASSGNYSVSYSDSWFGFNIGGGVDFGLTDKLILNLQLKYMTTSDLNRFMPSVGLVYKL